MHLGGPQNPGQGHYALGSIVDYSDELIRICRTRNRSRPSCRNWDDFEVSAGLMNCQQKIDQLIKSTDQSIPLTKVSIASERVAA